MDPAPGPATPRTDAPSDPHQETTLSNSPHHAPTPGLSPQPSHAAVSAEPTLPVIDPEATTALDLQSPAPPAPSPRYSPFFKTKEDLDSLNAALDALDDEWVFWPAEADLNRTNRRG